jgi:hypothetical protein
VDEISRNHHADVTKRGKQGKITRMPQLAARAVLWMNQKVNAAPSAGGPVN